MVTLFNQKDLYEGICQFFSLRPKTLSLFFRFCERSHSNNWKRKIKFPSRSGKRQFFMFGKYPGMEIVHQLKQAQTTIVTIEWVLCVDSSLPIPSPLSISLPYCLSLQSCRAGRAMVYLFCSPPQGLPCRGWERTCELRQQGFYSDLLLLTTPPASISTQS